MKKIKYVEMIDSHKERIKELESREQTLRVKLAITSHKKDIKELERCLNRGPIWSFVCNVWDIFVGLAMIIAMVIFALAMF